MKVIKFRIRNKSRKGVVLDYGKGGTKEFTWDEFNSVFDMVDKVYAVLKKEEQEKYDKIQELAASAAASFFMANSNDPKTKLDAYCMLGTEMQEIQKILDCSISEAVAIVRNYVDAMRNYQTNKTDNRKTNFNKPYRKDGKKFDRVSTNVGSRKTTKTTAEEKFNSATISLGDVPGFDKLKEAIKG